MNKPIPFQTLQQVALLKEKHSRRDVAKITGLSERQVKRYLAKYRELMEKKHGQILSQSSEEIKKLLQEYKEATERPVDDQSAYDQLQELAELWNIDKKLIDVEDVNYWDLTDHAVNGEVTVVFLGDVHWGSPHCNRKMLFDILKWISITPNAFVLLMGDMIEMSTKTSVGAGVYEQIRPPQEQIKETIAFLKPIRHKILGYFSGNHEFRAYKDLGIDVADLISSVLEIPYLGFTKLTTIKLGDHHYDIAGTHGNSGSRKPHTKLAKVFDLADIYDADLYVMGHVHDKLDSTKIYRKRVGREVKVFLRHFLVTGHFLNWKASYAEMATMGPSNLGSPTATFYKDEFRISLSK